MTSRRAKAMGRVINLDDDAAGPWSLVVSFGGVRTLIDEKRLQQLLVFEQEQLAGLAEGRRESEGVSVPEAPLRIRQIPVDPVTHGSLSSRITKIYNYSFKHQTLRPAHAGILGEFLQAFDWILPEHVGNKIPTLLGEIVEWQSVPPDLKAQIKEFLDRYLQVSAARSA